MAINRFMQATPLDFSQTPIYEPNWDFINETLAAQQQFYDTGQAASQLPIDAFGQEDITKASELTDYRQSMMEKIADVYATKGVNAGNKALKALTNQIQRDHTNPNSLVYRMQENAKTAREYLAKVDEWDVPAEYREKMKSFATDSWKGTLGEDGNLRSFNKPALSKYVSIVDRAMAFGKELSPQELESYNIYIDQTGTYWDKERTRKLSRAEIVAAVMPGLKEDQELNSWLTTSNTLDLYSSGLNKDNWQEEVDKHNMLIQEKLDDLYNTTDEELLAEFPNEKPAEARRAMELKYKEQLKNYNSYEELILDKNKEDIERAANVAGGIYSIDDRFLVRSAINENVESKASGKSSKDLLEAERQVLFSHDLITISSKVYQELGEMGIEGETINISGKPINLDSLTLETFNQEFKILEDQIKRDKLYLSSEYLNNLNSEYGLNLDPTDNPFTFKFIDTDGDNIDDDVEIVDPGSEDGYLRSAEEMGLSGEQAIAYDNARDSLIAKKVAIKEKLYKRNLLAKEKDLYFEQVDKIWEAHKPERIQEEDIQNKTSEYLETMRQIALDPEALNKAIEYQNSDRTSEDFHRIFKEEIKGKNGTQILQLKQEKDIIAQADVFNNNFVPQGSSISFSPEVQSRISNSVFKTIEFKEKTAFEKSLFKQFVKRYNQNIIEQIPIINLKNRALTGEAVDRSKVEAMSNTILTSLNNTPDDQIFFVENARQLKSAGLTREAAILQESEIKALRARIGDADLSTSDFGVIYDTRTDTPGWYYVLDLRKETDDKVKDLGFERERITGTDNRIMFKVPDSHIPVLDSTYGLDLNGAHGDLSTMMNLEQQFNDRGFATFNIPLGEGQGSINISVEKSIDFTEDWVTPRTKMRTTIPFKKILNKNEQDAPDVIKEYRVKVDGVEVAIKSDFDVVKMVKDLNYLNDAARILHISGNSREEIVDEIASQSTIQRMFPNEESRGTVERLVNKVLEANTVNNIFLPEGLTDEVFMDALAVPESRGAGNYQAISEDGQAWGRYQFRHDSFKRKIMRHYNTTDELEARRQFLLDESYQDELMRETIPEHRRQAINIVNELELNRDPNTLIHMIHLLGAGGTKRYLLNLMMSGSEYAEQQFAEYNRRNAAENQKVTDYTLKMLNFINNGG